MKPQHILLSLLLLYGSLLPTVQAQQEYFRAYDILAGPGLPGGNEEIKKVLKIRDTNTEYLMVGYTDSQGEGGRDGLVVWIDNSSTGTITNAITYGGTEDDEFTDVIFDGTDYYCLGITRSWTNGTTPNTELHPDIFLVKIKTNGDVIWAHHFGDADPNNSLTFDVAQGMCLAHAQNGGGVILCGTTRQHNASGGLKDAIAIHIDSDGNIVFGKRYSNSDEVIGYTAEKGLYTFLSLGVRESSNLRNSIVRIANDGDIIAHKGYNFPIPSNTNYTSSYTSMYVASSGRVIVGGGLRTPTSNPISSPIVNVVDMFSLESIPNVNSILDEPGTDDDGVRGWIEPRIQNDGFYMMTRNNNGNSGTRAATQAGLILYNNDIKIDWQKQYGWPGQYEYFSSVAQCDNEIIIAVGATATNANTVSDYDFIISSINASNGVIQVSCDDDIGYPDDTETITDYDYPLTVTDLETANCTSNCWVSGNRIFPPNPAVVQEPLEVHNIPLAEIVMVELDCSAP